MEKKWVVVIVIILIIFAVVLILLINKPKLSPTPNSVLENCNLVTYSSTSAKNLVFFATQEQAQDYSNYLETISPYTKDSFNIYYLDFKPDCELYQGKAVFCYSKELVKKASSCPNDIIIAVKDYPSNIRSSSYMNLVSINSNDNKNVLVHELGHALAFLADEYVPSTIPKKSENCQKTCIFSECFQGCSNQDYYRSINNGVMKTLSSNKYGTYNENIISKYITSNSITANAIENQEDCSSQEYYLIQGNYTNNNLIIQSKSIEQGCVGNNGVGDFSYNLILDNNLNYTGTFNPEFIFTDSSQGGEVFQSTTEFILKVPIIENSKSLEISNDNKLIEVNLQDIDSRPCKI